MSKYPWEKGNEGWDNYGDFTSWLKDKLGEGFEEWVDDSPTYLMSLFIEAWNTRDPLTTTGGNITANQQKHTLLNR